MPKAAIYHFTNGSDIRPIVHLKELEKLKKYANKRGYEDIDVYVDKTITKHEQDQLKELMDNIGDYDVLIMKDFYHLRKNTGICISELLNINKQGVDILTIRDGRFDFEEAPFDKELNVAIYYCGLEIVGHSVDLQYEIMELFIKTKTKWKLIDKYCDVNGNRSNANQKEQKRLIKNKNKYDVLLVQSFNSVHWRTGRFCVIRNQLELDIYSMQEDVFLPYRKEN